ncbi:olfactory receptor 998 [Xenopus laevis]|uniref:Olfactory receptor n=1 Tax=Xenopus laevis TaxID=8355 RepID=A0A8J0UP87_XENLA|nr:olfactory receptor 998 [Xenopus laevis]
MYTFVNNIIRFSNKTTLDDFILTGLSTKHSIEFPLFMLFLVIYVFSFLSNISMTLLIGAVPKLHTPMYFFLSHLSLIDMCYSSTILPKMLSDFLTKQKYISFRACATQMFFFAMFATSECFMVTAMAYDRYVAICQPLLYHINMNNTFCWLLVIGSYMSSLVASVTHTVAIFSFPLCGSHEINHFYCDIPPLLKLICKHSHARKSVIFSLSLAMGIVSLFIILTSYVYIISTILGIQSTHGRSKAFSTCASHLTVVILFYSSVFCIYFSPSLGLELGNIDKFFSIFYSVASPLLNPLIYSFKNTEVKNALKHFLILNIKMKHLNT